MGKLLERVTMEMPNFQEHVRVKSVIGDEYEVSVMMKSGKYYRWPDKPDQLYYKKEDVVRIIQPPEPVGSKTRSQYCFADLE